MGQDAGFRCMLLLLGIRPFFVTTDELFCAPAMWFANRVSCDIRSRAKAVARSVKARL